MGRASQAFRVHQPQMGIADVAEAIQYDCEAREIDVGEPRAMEYSQEYEKRYFVRFLTASMCRGGLQID